MKIKLLAVCATALLLAGCEVNHPKAQALLEAQGYRDVTLGGHAWFGGCSDSDGASTTFKAIGAASHTVEGVVCSGVGLFAKGMTVRVTGAS